MLVNLIHRSSTQQAGTSEFQDRGGDLTPPLESSSADRHADGLDSIFARMTSDKVSSFKHFTVKVTIKSLTLLLHAHYSSPEGLGVLQHLLDDPFPFSSAPVLKLSPLVTCQTRRIQIFPNTVIPGFHWPACSVRSSNITKKQLVRRPIFFQPCNVTKLSQAPALEQISNQHS